MKPNMELLRKWVCLLIFSLGVLLRGIPEIIVEKYPVGYDTTAHYVANILNFNELSLIEKLREAPLFYSIIWFLTEHAGSDVLMLLKISGPILYGLLGVSFYFFLENGLGWSFKKSSIGTVTFILQLVTLRISWDMYRLEFGLIFMFLTLTLTSKESARRGYMIAVLSILTVLAHQIASIILFFTMVWIELFKKGLGKRKLKDLLPLTPSGFLFAVILYITFFVPVAQDPRIIGVGPKTAFLSYFQVDPRFLEGSYLLIARNIGVLLLFCYGLLSPFIIKGFEKNRLLNPFLIILSVGSFSPLVIPWVSLPVTYWRWLLLLIIPFAAYSANGFMKFRKLWRRHGIGLILILLIFLSLALGYASGNLPLRSMYYQLKGGTPKYLSPNNTSFNAVESVATYIPSSMIASPISVGDVTQGIDDCITALKWLSEHTRENSCLLTEERFQGWARIYTSENITLVTYMAFYPVSLVVKELDSYRFQHIYLIWYIDVNIEGFKEVYRHGIIAIYEYEAT